MNLPIRVIPSIRSWYFRKWLCEIKKYIAKPLGSISLERFSNCFERSQKLKQSVDKTF